MKLEDVLKQSEVTVSVGGKRLLLRKWTVRQSFKHIGTVAGCYAELAGSDLLKSDLTQLLMNSFDVVLPIAADTILNDKNGFESIDDAAKWVEGLDMFDAVELFTVIFRMNFPDKKKLENLSELIPPLRILVQRFSKAASGFEKFSTSSVSKKSKR